MIVRIPYVKRLEAINLETVDIREELRQIERGSSYADCAVLISDEIGIGYHICEHHPGGFALEVREKRVIKL